MDSKRHSNDIDLVLPDQYIIPPTRKAKEPAPKPWKLPTFEPLQINDWHYRGEASQTSIQTILSIYLAYSSQMR
jgi:hypothetical protein